MTIEEKAKAYDEALKYAMIYYKNGNEDMKTMMKTCFPVLVEENEGEKIRNFLIKQANSVLDSITSDDEEIPAWKSALAWLERQGNLMKALQISNAEIGELIEKNYYLREQLEKQGKNNMGISEATKQKLEDNLNKALEQETQESCNEFLDKQGEQKSTIEMITPEESLGIDSDTYNKIVDECIYGEQKSSWSEEDNKMSRFIGNAITVDDASIYLESKGIQVIDAHVWLNGLKDKVQPKQEWSDVDKDILFRTIDNLKFLRDTISIDPKYAINIIDIEREITWLNSLRPQNKTYYWTENEIKFAISDFIRGAESYEKMVEKLRCLKPQNTWKPSDEQIMALRWVLNHIPYDSHKEEISGLLEQLKKLSEE